MQKISVTAELSSACGLTMGMFVGKRFDGASNMSGYVSGVSEKGSIQTQIFNPLPQPRSQYGHCCKL